MSRSTAVGFAGVDTGGTFTDVVVRDRHGRMHVAKVLSTPDDPSRAIAQGLARLGVDPLCSGVVHGTTVATNALLERRVAHTALVVTAGFEDILEIGRQQRPELYALHVRRPAPLIPAHLCLGLQERMGHDGTALLPLCEHSLSALLEILLQQNVQAVAVCLLHAYANDVHERRVGRRLREALPGVHISLSCEVLNEFREFERASTTAINAAVGPVMAAYLRRLKERVPAKPLEILLSHGGRADVAFASDFPVHTVLSGPAGGVVGAFAAARELGITRIIGFDMGGTSTDVSLCDGAPVLTTASTIGEMPVAAPALDIFTVGAGGGSVAWIDAGGALRVGPRSAGASPGPACYDQGGERATVTDAHLFLGRLRPDRFLGGQMALNLDAARRAISQLAAELEVPEEEAARGILDVADASMVRAIKVISLERGHDPRDFCLVSFGGAGGLHACRLAEALDMDAVLVPRHPGLLSAWGMLQAPPQRIYSRTILVALAAALRPGDEHQRLRQTLLELETQARQDMDQGPDHAVPSAMQCHWIAGLRYRGQSFEIPVTVSWSAGGKHLEDPHERFHSAHEALYGYASPNLAIELVNLRLQATMPAPTFGDALAQVLPEVATGEQSAPIWLEDEIRVAQLLERDTLMEGQALEGPAVVTELSGTTVIPPGWQAVVQRGHLLMRRLGRSGGTL